MSVPPRPGSACWGVPGRLGTIVANPSWPQRWVVRADVRDPRGSRMHFATNHSGWLTVTESHRDPVREAGSSPCRGPCLASPP